MTRESSKRSRESKNPEEGVQQQEHLDSSKDSNGSESRTSPRQRRKLNDVAPGLKKARSPSSEAKSDGQVDVGHVTFSRHASEATSTLIANDIKGAHPANPDWTSTNQHSGNEPRPLSPDQKADHASLGSPLAGTELLRLDCTLRAPQSESDGSGSVHSDGICAISPSGSALMAFGKQPSSSESQVGVMEELSALIGATNGGSPNIGVGARICSSDALQASVRCMLWLSGMRISALALEPTRIRRLNGAVCYSVVSDGV